VPECISVHNDCPPCCDHLNVRAGNKIVSYFASCPINFEEKKITQCSRRLFKSFCAFKAFSCVMASSVRDDEFDEYDKPGTERSRRRRGDEDLDSDLEGDLLEEDWLTARKNTSDASDEELNDDLLQSDEEDANISGQGVSLSLNAPAGLSSSFDLAEQSLEDPGYSGAHRGPGGRGLRRGRRGGGLLGRGVRGSLRRHNAALAEDQTEYVGEQAEDEAYQDEVLDIGINEPIDDEFQVDEYSTDYSSQQIEVQVDVQDVPETEEAADSAQIMETEEAILALGSDFCIFGSVAGAENVENVRRPDAKVKAAMPVDMARLS
ncbi:hypothetical protein SKAU_G00073570, partial [Synaphobranchus kaupii]